MSNKKELVKKEEAALSVDQELVQQLRESYPFDPSALRISLPRLSMLSQDKTETTGTGKNKKIEVLEAAGTFFTEQQTDEVDPETGNKKWGKEELGDTIEGIIVFQRKQLRMYDEKTELYTSSPVFDSNDEVVPLFCNKAEIARGTVEELKAKYQYQDKEGKTKSKLEDNKILYILFNDSVYQMNLRGSSMYSFLTYARKVTPPAVLTKFSSEAREKGEIAWNQMTFEVVRSLDTEELKTSIEKVNEIRNSIAIEKASYANMQSSKKQSDDDFNKDVDAAIEASKK